MAGELPGDSWLTWGPLARSKGTVNTLILRQNRCHFADDIFKGIFLDENVVYSIVKKQNFTMIDNVDFDIYHFNRAFWMMGLIKFSKMLITTPGGCFTNVLRALQDILSKFVYCWYSTSYEKFKLKLCTCAKSIALGTRTKFQLEIFNINVISGIVYFSEIIMESSWNVSETPPRA